MIEAGPFEKGAAVQMVTCPNNAQLMGYEKGRSYVVERSATEQGWSWVKLKNAPVRGIGAMPATWFALLTHPE